MNNSLRIFPAAPAAKDFQQLYQQVFLQLKKDFHPFADAGDPPLRIEPEWLYEHVLLMLGEVLKKESSALGAILYRVDIPEKMARTIGKNSIGKNPDEELAAMILRREAQKVWIRNNFKA